MNMESIKPAIVAVGYNRPEAMKRLLNSVAHAFYPFDDIDLIVSIDESSRSNDVQQVAEQIPWNHGKKIIKRFDERQGLRKHIIQCGDLSEKYGAVIILEDDLVVAPSFYFYTYLAVNHYATEDRLSGIALYSHSWNGYANLEFRPVHNEFDAYFGQFSITWGQCWTAKQWNGFKTWYLAHENSLPEQNTAMPAAILHWSKQSWGKYFISYMVENDLYYLIPYCALTTNFTEIADMVNQTYWRFATIHRNTSHYMQSIFPITDVCQGISVYDAVVFHLQAIYLINVVYDPILRIPYVKSKVFAFQKDTVDVGGDFFLVRRE